MAKGSEIPAVDNDVTVKEALFEISAKGLGMTTVLDSKGKLEGIFTDGDLRRYLDMGHDMKTTPIAQIMTKNCKTIEQDLLAVEALNLLEENSITALVVTDSNKRPVGVVHMHQILKAGVA
jgi:arabinose-5-phosphate isomerase